MKNESKTSNGKLCPVQDILGELRTKSRGGGYIYRGENKCHPSVSSSLYRDFNIKDDNFDIELVEKEMLNDAKKHVGELALNESARGTEVPIDTEDLERLTELQHYGGKTNFIDFTTDYLIALFFACDGEPEKHGRVILQKSEEIESRVHQPQKPRHRVVAQKSIFVRPPHGFFYPDKEKEVVRIEKHLKQEMLSYLRNYHGISTQTIYNDLHGFIKHQDRHGDAYTYFYRGMARQNRADKATSPDNKQDEYRSAIDHYTKAMELNPEYAEAYYSRGSTYLKINEIPEAIQDFSKTIELNPEYAEAYYSRGKAYDTKGEIPEAIQDYNKTIELNPEYTEAYYSRGSTYLKINEIPEAIQDYNKAIELNENVEAYYSRGSTYLNTDEIPEAIQDYNKAIELNENVEAYYSRGTAYDAKGDIDEAIQDYNKAIELNENAEVYYSRGTAYDAKGDIDEAIQDYNKAIELNPEYAEAYYSRGSTYLNTDEIPEAIQDFNKAIELNPEYAEAYYSRGSTYLNIKEIPEAIQDFSKTIELNPDNAEAYYSRGKASLSLEEWRNAKADLIIAKKMGVDIVVCFYNDDESIEAFEAKHKVEVPDDIAGLFKWE